MATWYVDPIGGNDANAGTSVGAALATIGAAWAKGFAANEKIYLKGTTPELVTLAVSGTGNLYCEIIGYTTTPGDEGMAIITAGDARAWCIDMNSKTNWRLQNIELKAPTTAIFRNTGTLSLITTNCKMTKGTAACPLFSNNSGVFSAMTWQAYNTTLSQIAAGAANINLTVMEGCTLTACGAISIGTFNGNFRIERNVFRDYTNAVFTGGGSSPNIRIAYNTFYNCTSAINLDSTALSNVFVTNNIFSTVSGTAVTLSATASDTLISNYNSFHSCTTRYGNSRADGANDTTLGSSPFSSTTTLALSALNQGQRANVSRGAVQYAGGGSSIGFPTGGPGGMR